MKPIQTGKLKNGEIYAIHRLTAQHIPKIKAVQDAALAELKNPHELQSLTDVELRYNLSNKGLVIGILLNDKQLIAFRTLLKPKITDDHIGYDIGFESHELNQIIYQEITIVHPAYRGNGLQQTLGKCIMQTWKNIGDTEIRYVCSTVAPSNIPSLKDKFAQHKEIFALKEKYGGKLRFIFLKDLNEPYTPNRQWSITEDVSLMEYDRQIELLSSGYRGFRLIQETNEYFIRYGLL